jgi:hypothetical protein
MLVAHVGFLRMRCLFMLVDLDTAGTLSLVP